MQKTNSTKFCIQKCFKNIQFSKEYHSLYNNILRDMHKLTDAIFFRLILQAAFQLNFCGYFDELYVDVIKRSNQYKKEIFKNFEISFFGEKTFYEKIYTSLCCIRNYNINFNGKMSNKQIFYHRKIRLIDFDEIIEKYFELKNKEKENYFIDLCEKICSEAMTTNLNNNNKMMVIPV